MIRAKARYGELLKCGVLASAAAPVVFTMMLVYVELHAGVGLMATLKILPAAFCASFFMSLFYTYLVILLTILVAAIFRVRDIPVFVVTLLWMVFLAVLMGWGSSWNFLTLGMGVAMVGANGLLLCFLTTWHRFKP